MEIEDAFSVASLMVHLHNFDLYERDRSKKH